MILIRKIIVVCFAILVLLSATSFTLSIHFCGSRIADVGVFDRHATCAMLSTLPPCHKPSVPDCCHDSYVSYDGQDYVAQKIVTDNHVIDVITLQQPYVILDQLFSSVPDLMVDHYKDDPPLPKPDKSILYQVFII